MSLLFNYILAFVVGLAVGSFLNVLIYRLPRRLKFVWERSFCPQCRAPIAFYDNIPLVSFMILAGKCRRCGKSISWQYPLVEFLNGAAYLFFLWKFGLTAEFAVFSLLASALLVILFIDLEFQIIPDVITLPGMVIGLGLSFLPGGITVWQSLLGLAAGGGGLYLVAMLGDWLFKRESLGGGDIKMAAMLGAFLGWQKIIFIFFASAFLGLIISLAVMLFSKKLRETRMVPFGPFIAVAAIIAIIYGQQIIDSYINHFWRL